MAQVSIKTNINNRIEELKKEVINIRSFLIGIAGKDKEGSYKPNFVKKILKAGKEKVEYVFDKNSFLKNIQSS